MAVVAVGANWGDEARQDGGLPGRELSDSSEVQEEAMPDTVINHFDKFALPPSVSVLSQGDQRLGTGRRSGYPRVRRRGRQPSRGSPCPPSLSR